MFTLYILCLHLETVNFVRLNLNYIYVGPVNRDNVMSIKHDLVKTAFKPEHLSVDLVEVGTPWSFTLENLMTV